MEEVTTDRDVSRRGQSHHNQSLRDVEGASAGTVLAFLLGMVFHILNEQGAQLLHQQRAGEVAAGGLAAPLLRTQRSGPSNMLAGPSLTRRGGELHDEDEVSDGDDTSMSPRETQTGSRQAVKSPPQGRISEPSHIQLLSMLLRDPHKVIPARRSISAVDGADVPQRQHRMRLPRSSSAPSRVLLRNQVPSGQDEFGRRDLIPSPPPSPVSGESLDNYLYMAYNKWVSRHAANDAPVLESPHRLGSSMVERPPARPAEEGRSPGGRRVHHHEQSSAGHTPEESLPFFEKSVGIRRRSSSKADGHLKRSSTSSEDSGCPMPPPFDDFCCQDDGVTDGYVEETPRRRESLSSTNSTRRSVRWSGSAPSAYLSSRLTTAHDDWPRCGRDHSARQLQRAASVVWSPCGSPEASYEPEQRTSHLDATPSQAKYTHTGHTRHSSSGSSGSSRSPSPSFWKKARRADRARAGNPPDEMVSTASTSLHQGGIQPLQMTIQFYNHPSSVTSDEHVALRAPSVAGNARGWAKQMKLLRSASTSKGVPLSKRNPAKSRSGSLKGPHLNSPLHEKDSSPPLPVQEQIPDARTGIYTHKWDKHAAQHLFSAETSPLDNASNRRQADPPSTTRPTVKIDTPLVSGPQSSQPSNLTSKAGASVSTQNSTTFRSRLPVPVWRTSTRRNDMPTSSSLSVPHTLKSQLSMPAMSVSSSFSLPHTLKSQLSVAQPSPTSMSSCLSAPHELRSHLTRTPTLSVSDNVHLQLPANSAGVQTLEGQAIPPLVRPPSSHLTTAANQSAADDAPSENSFYSLDQLHEDLASRASSDARLPPSPPRGGLPFSHQLTSTVGAILKNVINAGGSSEQRTRFIATAHSPSGSRAQDTGTLNVESAGEQTTMNSSCSLPNGDLGSSFQGVVASVATNPRRAPRSSAGPPVEDEFRG